MKDIIEEYHELNSLYSKLGKELAEAIDVADAMDPHALASSVLRSHDLFGRITQISSRTCQLADYWKKGRTILDAETRNTVQSLETSAKVQALKLHDACNVHAARLEAHRENLLKQLDEIRKGSCFLKSIKPVKNNYPKFVDSQA